MSMLNQQQQLNSRLLRQSGTVVVALLLLLSPTRKTCLLGLLANYLFDQSVPQLSFILWARGCTQKINMARNGTLTAISSRFALISPIASRLSQLMLAGSELATLSGGLLTAMLYHDTTLDLCTGSRQSQPQHPPMADSHSCNLDPVPVEIPVNSQSLRSPQDATF